MAIASGTCVSFCNQPKAHFAWPPLGVRPWDNRGKEDSMLVKRIAACIGLLHKIHIYLQPFPSNSTRKFKSSPF